uniref:Uncharacterized protein n=1 Tax=Rhizophagus irregularis (strain DAOM 181602 / DAOM 197198 / MUCL 43194) TaxID=747089 RepID=U9TL13_RHIID
MIKAEHEKAEIGYKQFEDSFGSKCPIKQNCFVVDCGNFKAFYGYIFHPMLNSLQLFFTCFTANDKLDANTAKEYELRTIRGIGKAIAFEITLKRKERAFEDENDLYNRVKRIPPEAKTKIEVDTLI